MLTGNGPRFLVRSSLDDGLASSLELGIPPTDVCARGRNFRGSSWNEINNHQIHETKHIYEDQKSTSSFIGCSLKFLNKHVQMGGWSFK